MTDQELYSKVRAHLLKQMKRSMVEVEKLGVPGCYGEICAYRGKNGLKCAIGILIPDEKYSPKLERQAAGSENVMLAAGIAPEQASLACALQLVHDAYGTEAWATKLDGVADSFNLSPI